MKITKENLEQNYSIRAKCSELYEMQTMLNNFSFAMNVKLKAKKLNEYLYQVFKKNEKIENLFVIKFEDKFFLAFKK